jgi:hypothetical protein
MSKDGKCGLEILRRSQLEIVDNIGSEKSKKE